MKDAIRDHANDVTGDKREKGERPSSAGRMEADELMAAMDRLESIAHWLDSRFLIPGTSIRFGLDSLFGLIPGVGDTLGLAASFYIYRHAGRLGLPFPVRMKMLWNIFIDWLVGLTPLAGDIFDIGFKANRRNLALIRRHIHGTHDMKKAQKAGEETRRKKH